MTAEVVNVMLGSSLSFQDPENMPASPPPMSLGVPVLLATLLANCPTLVDLDYQSYPPFILQVPCKRICDGGNVRLQLQLLLSLLLDHARHQVLGEVR